MSDKLKPVRCGCGGEPVVGHIKKTSYLPKDRWYIGCPKCDICTGIYDTEAEAVTAWNTAMGAKELKALPSAEPERKKGKWEVQPSTGDDRPFIWWKCSECGHVIFSETERDRKEFHAFCGRCGADME